MGDTQCDEVGEGDRLRGHRVKSRTGAAELGEIRAPDVLASAGN